MEEILGVPSTFGFPFFLASAPNKVAFRRLPPASTPFRSPPRPYLSHTLPPQCHRNRRLAVACAAHPNAPAPDEAEARLVLRDFLIEHGICSDLAEQRAASWDEIVELLSSKLRSLHESEQQLGAQLAGPQLIDVFTPYLRSILKEYGDVAIIGRDRQFPSAPGGESTSGEAPTRWLKTRSKAIANLDKQLSEGCPPPVVLHLMNVGLDLHRTRSMVRKYPYVGTGSMKQKLDTMMKFLRSLGVPETDVPEILHKCPRLISLSIEENILPSMALLESKGVDKAWWPKIICDFPSVFTAGKAKVEAVVGYFSEMGFSASDIGTILRHCPQILSFSIKAKLEPTNMFFLDNGFTVEEIRIMLLRLGNFYEYNLERSLKPKWEFLLMMGYTKSDLVKFPSYFGFSLEKRIKPRYELAVKHGICWSLSYLLSLPDDKFQRAIKAAPEAG